MRLKEQRAQRQQKLKEHNIATITLTIDIDSDVYNRFKEISKYQYATSIKKNIATLMDKFVEEHDNKEK